MNANWIVVLAHGNLDLLQAAVASFHRQDIEGGARILIVNNESDPATTAWIIREQAAGRVSAMHFFPQRGVAHGWNSALRYLFGSERVERVLVVNQDLVLRPDTYRWLDADGGGFVTAVGSADATCVERPGPEPAQLYSLSVKPPKHYYAPTYPLPRPEASRPHPDFSCFLIRRNVWERVGEFDEGFAGAFGEDCDMHVRMHAAGITAYCIDVPFYHVGGGSQTVKRASSAERERIVAQAARNRAYFERKWGFPVPTPENGGVEYYKFFGTAAPDER